MGAIVAVETAIQPRPESWLGHTLKGLLIFNWGALFAFCIGYITEDALFRTPVAHSVEVAPAVEVKGLPHPTIVDQTVELPVRNPRPAATAFPQPLNFVASLPPILATQFVMPSADAQPTSTSAEYVGTWGPTADACGVKSRRRGYLPATITTERAKAGGTVCTFRDARRVGNVWAMAAECGDRDRRWSSQIRLTVDGDRLTWASAKGTSGYVRCNRRAV